MTIPDHYTCEQFFRRLADFLDSELTARESALMEEHLKQCAVCLEEYTFERSLLEEVRHKLKPAELPPGLQEKISAALRAAEQDPST